MAQCIQDRVFSTPSFLQAEAFVKAMSLPTPEPKIANCSIRERRFWLYYVLTAIIFGISLVAEAAPTVQDIKLVELVGRPGHQGLFPIQGQPIEGTPAMAKAFLQGHASNVNLILRDASGGFLSNIPMLVPSADKVIEGTYFADIVVPSVPFTMSISGVDQAGNNFETPPAQSSPITPQTFDIRILPTIFDVAPDFPLYFSVRVTNYSVPDTFSVSLTSDAGGTVQPVSNNITLANNQSADVQFLYTAPATLGQGFSLITLTAQATSNTPNGGTNQAVVELNTPTKTPGKLTAWFSNNKPGELKPDSKKPITIWLCNDNLDSQQILLANGLYPLSVKTILLSTHKSEKSEVELPKGIQCTASSVLKAQFDTLNMYATLDELISIPSKDGLSHITITAFKNDGTYMIGYVSLIFEAHEATDKTEVSHESK